MTRLDPLLFLAFMVLAGGTVGLAFRLTLQALRLAAGWVAP